MNFLFFLVEIWIFIEIEIYKCTCLYNWECMFYVGFKIEINLVFGEFVVYD